MKYYSTIDDIEMTEEMKEQIETLRSVFPIPDSGIIAIVVCKGLEPEFIKDGLEVEHRTIHDIMSEDIAEVEKGNYTHEQIVEALKYYQQFIWNDATVIRTKEKGA